LPFRANTPSWVKARKELGIGASEAAAAVGLGKYGGPFDVYGVKLGLRPDLIPTEEMEWGHILEPVVARVGAKRFGVKVQRGAHMLQSTRWPWMFCTPDYWAGEELVQIKTANIFAKDFGEEGTEEVPIDYLLQEYHEMAVTGAPRAHLWALFGGQHLKRFLIERDEEKIEDLAEGERILWQEHIVPRIPPQIDGSEGAAAYLAERYANANGATIDLTPEMRDLAFSYLGINAQLADLEAKKKLVGNLLRDFIKESSRAQGGDVRVTMVSVAAKHVEAKAYDTAPYRYPIVTPLEA
jgi:putative phage-type endonuclease